MAGPKLDGAGTAKMATLESRMNHLQRLHSTSSNARRRSKGKAPAAPSSPRCSRSRNRLVGLLKGQFGMIADLVAAFLLSSTRSARQRPEQDPGLREGVAQIRVQLELAVAKTIELHTAADSH